MGSMWVTDQESRRSCPCVPCLHDSLKQTASRLEQRVSCENELLLCSQNTSTDDHHASFKNGCRHTMFRRIDVSLAQTQDGNGFVAQRDKTAKTGTSGTSHFASHAARLFLTTGQCQCQTLFLEPEEHRVHWRKTVKTGRVQPIEQLIR